MAVNREDRHYERLPNARHRPHADLLAAIGANLRRLRAARGLTQERLAELVDVHPRMIQKIEYGETNLLATTAIRLHAALGCEWDELMPPLSARTQVTKLGDVS